ncbi:metal-dependent transcriptional regulator [Adhaeribacter sp. BT258]|uniref:Transcriptional regulator MntR n=1 Tax=Adhaeribacter terrigena TaxID=2793070 RepID=A0ABS1C082_9BACT|nr:metal-dependent transcriptional regulator [Adhaeribacter terrigena]MBK0402814.1 metal-dependent transcriptional regulator [Adhaeribacter terrigena]
MLSYTEENYIKAIYKLSQEGDGAVNTNAIAEVMQTKAASVSDMLRRLNDKEIINYVKYRGVTLTEAGRKTALQLVRKHRLWEVFLVDKLKFNWDEVHEVAEELEHITSELMIRRLDEFLGYPKYDPHGDPIPTEDGLMTMKQQVLLSELEPGQAGIVMGVKDSQPLFLQHLDKIGIYLGAKIKVTDKVEYDNSLEINLDNKKQLSLSAEVSKNIFVSA